MKKSIAILSIIFCFAWGNAQDISQHALGLRLGGNKGFGSEISYQRSLESNKRLEFNLGWRNSDGYDAFKLMGVHQWVWHLKDNFNWYAGVGGGLGAWNYEKKSSDVGNIRESGSFLALAGNLGIEYHFDIPILISIDMRPELYFGNGIRGESFGPDIALSVKYRF